MRLMRDATPDGELGVTVGLDDVKAFRGAALAGPPDTDTSRWTASAPPCGSPPSCTKRTAIGRPYRLMPRSVCPTTGCWTRCFRPAPSCSPAVAPGTPVILGGGEPISNEQGLFRQAGSRLSAREGRVSLAWMVVNSRVAAVRIDAKEVVASTPDPRLPRGWRAVIAFTSVPPSQIRPVPLDRYGHAIAAHGASSSVIPGSGGVSLARTYVPESSSPASCSISGARLANVTAQWGVVATTTPALGSRVVPNTLFSCARSWFSIRGQNQAPSAAVLLNAQDPRRRAPALPGLEATGQPGVFSEPSAEILAKRVGRGWLVVQSQSVSLGKMLLGAIHVRGSAIARR